MTNRLLAIGPTYLPPATPLKAPEREVRNWMRLLVNEYGFNADEVKLLPGTEATRPNVLKEFRALLAKTQSNDQAFVIFCGHGGVVGDWVSDEQFGNIPVYALMLYGKRQGKLGFQRASFTMSDVKRLLGEERSDGTKLPPDAHVVSHVDACFSAQFDADDPLRLTSDSLIDPRVLFIPNAVPALDGAVPAARSFAALIPKADWQRPVPIVVAASRIDEPAFEVGPQGDRRMAFSAEAIAYLESAYDAPNAPTVTYRGLVDKINPIGEVQYAEVVSGDKNAPYAGKTGSSGVAATTRAAGVASDSEAAEAEAYPPLTINTIGLVTLINLNNATFRNRLVYPRDTYSQSGDPEEHVAFLEVAHSDMPKDPDSTLFYDTITRGGKRYYRWILTKHRVSIGNVSGTSAPVERSTEFKRYVPSIPDVCKELNDVQEPRKECQRDWPQPDLFTAFFDLQCGSVDIGQLTKSETAFVGKNSGEEFKPAKKTPMSIIFTVPLEENYAVLYIDEEPNKHAAVIYVNAGSAILTGNAREIDINGPGSDDDPKHFTILYSLSPIELYDPGIPKVKAVPTEACPPTGWP